MPPNKEQNKQQWFLRILWKAGISRSDPCFWFGQPTMSGGGGGGDCGWRNRRAQKDAPALSCPEISGTCAELSVIRCASCHHYHRLSGLSEMIDFLSANFRSIVAVGENKAKSNTGHTLMNRKPNCDGQWRQLFCGYVVTVCHATGPTIRSPAQYNATPRVTVPNTARQAFSTAPGGRVKRAGPIVASRAAVTVTVKRIETAVLMATIWPNLAKGTMTQKKSGTVEITVVTALETIATPT
ncbi:hypothetical protein JZ751_001448 [Albula glossodonta]|uniref:Uncharacterized protein n=1 Tax=Albula glossodonta TaxID=121402 RepID=A0A8T2PTQ0_9TELE|nr:hypothetical protein JZ751_001448 [Albula glossodonta]